MDIRFWIEQMDHICDMFSMEGVRPTHVRETMQDPYMFDILHTVLCDMTLVMDHVIGALTLI